MKPAAYLSNTSRGPLIDRAALIETLVSSQSKEPPFGRPALCQPRRRFQASVSDR